MEWGWEGAYGAWERRGVGGWPRGWGRGRLGGGYLERVGAWEGGWRGAGGGVQRGSSGGARAGGSEGMGHEGWGGWWVGWGEMNMVGGVGTSAI